MAKIDLSAVNFLAINKAATESFKQQRELIKRLGKGETVLCETCKKPLTLSVSAKGEPGVSCAQGCTHIDLEL